jgi:hypothetical protein
VEIPESDGFGVYAAANSAAAVVCLVQKGVIELHVWGSTTRDLAKPDRMVFDLDPDTALPWREVMAAARAAHLRRLPAQRPRSHGDRGVLGARAQGRTGFDAAALGRARRAHEARFVPRGKCRAAPAGIALRSLEDLPAHRADSDRADETQTGNHFMTDRKAHIPTPDPPMPENPEVPRRPPPTVPGEIPPGPSNDPLPIDDPKPRPARPVRDPDRVLGALS